MLVAKLPGSTYATAATNAGPRKGSSARRPRVWPLSAFSAARRTRSSPGSAATAGSTVRLRASTSVRRGGSARAIGFGLHEDRSGEPERDADFPSLQPALDRRLVVARRHHVDPSARGQAAPLELAQPRRVVVRHALNDDVLTGRAIGQRAVAERSDLTGERRDRVAVRIELRPAEELEDPGL